MRAAGAVKTVLVATSDPQKSNVLPRADSHPRIKERQAVNRFVTRGGQYCWTMSSALGVGEKNPAVIRAENKTARGQRGRARAGHLEAVETDSRDELLGFFLDRRERGHA